mgnify:CR=1 FL=1
MRLKKKITSVLNQYCNRNQKTKAEHELSFWSDFKKEHPVFPNTHYEYFYTRHYGLEKEFYLGKKILDIGCGPMGSLEWATMAEERTGLDPLVEKYSKFGIREHKMKYIQACSEDIPFADNYFDVVSSFNSLDTVDEVDKTINEIIRVLKPGGLFILLVELHDPTPNQPKALSFDITEHFKTRLTILDEKHYEKFAGGIYESIYENIPFNHKNSEKRYGILSAKFKK